MRRGNDRHDHSKEHLTSVDTRRLRTNAGDGYAAFGWDYPGSTLLEVRILRSESGATDNAGDGAAQGQLLVYQGVSGSYRDIAVLNGHKYYYSVFARHPGSEEWARWGRHELRPCTEPEGSRRGISSILRGCLGNRVARVLAGVLLCTAALTAAVPQSAVAVSSAKSSASAESAGNVAGDARQIAAADPRVAAVLGGLASPQVKVVSWPAASQAAGATVYYNWPAAEARDIAAVWPLVKTAGGNRLPVSPYTLVARRLRIQDLTALRVDVLLQSRRVIQIAPMDGDTQFKLLEETWPPFSWIPRLTERPWLLLPVFMIVGLVIIARAWRRSRAWNRQLPSMTRHDRQFIGRLVVILFLIAGLVCQIWGAVYAASAPAVDPRGFNAGELAALPLLLISPGIFVAAFVLEFSPAPHRAAWALVAVLAAADCAYNLATALTGTTTNLNLTYYILLAILCLLAAPRAFSSGRMGWSRNRLPRYG